MKLFKIFHIYIRNICETDQLFGVLSKVERVIASLLILNDKKRIRKVHIVGKCVFRLQAHTHKETHGTR